MKRKMLFLGMIALMFIPTACNQIKDSPLTNIFSDESPLPTEPTQNYRPHTTGVTGEFTGNRHALIIANADYTIFPRLDNPLNDGRDMKKTLHDVGFKIVYRENTTDKRQIKEAVKKFISRLQPGDLGLFYYAGHAVQVKGVNYLIPTKVELPSETEVEYETLSAQYVLDKMEEVGNGLNLVFLDACRDNPLPKTMTRSIGTKGGLAKMRQPKGSIIAFATSPDNTAEDGTGKNGVYTKYLIEAIKTPGLTVEEMLKKVRNGVWDETKGRQIPWENSSLRGKFCFSGCVTENEKASKKDLLRLEREKARLEAQLREKNQAQRPQDNTQSKALRQKQEEENRRLEERLNALEERLRENKPSREELEMPVAF